jgi:hypothetical protein
VSENDLRVTGAWRVFAVLFAIIAAVLYFA